MRKRERQHTFALERAAAHSSEKGEKAIRRNFVMPLVDRSIEVVLDITVNLPLENYNTKEASFSAKQLDKN